MNIPTLSAKDLNAGYQKKAVVSGINFNALKGQLICLLGPNGAGKSTILRTVSGLLAPVNGIVKIDGQNIFNIKKNVLAKKLSLVLTDSISPSMMTVRELAAMGRMPYTGFFGKLSEDDHKIVDNALEAVGADSLKNRSFSELSDGEKQKVMIARALVQEPELIVLDEPTSHLDIKHKIEVIRILQRLSREKGITCILSLHDIDLAMKGCQTVILVQNNKIVAQGAPEELLSSGCIQKLYNISDAVYDELLGAVEFNGNDCNDVFVISGGGSGIPIYRIMSRSGYGITAGILHENDIDVPVAKAICSGLITTPAFEPIGDIELKAAEQLIVKAKYVVDAGCRFGSSNQRNIELFKIAQRLNKPIFSLRTDASVLIQTGIDIENITFCNNINDLTTSIQESLK